MARADEREAQKILPGGTEGRSSDARNAGFLEKTGLHFFGGKAGFLDIHPGIEGAVGRHAAEPPDPGESSAEVVAAPAIFRDHRLYRIRRILKRLVSSDLGAFRRP